MRVVLTGGGTGGHIYPALAIARMLRENHPDVQLLYIGTKKGLERELVPREQIPFAFIEVEGLRRTLSLRALKTAWMALTSIVTASRILARFRPDVVIGTGGYVVVPVIAAAHLRGMKTGILELDAHAGLANRLVYRFADTVMLGMENKANTFAKAKHVVLTGNPRASEVASLPIDAKKLCQDELGLKHDVPIVTIVSGSRGASPINQTVMAWLEGKSTLPYQVVWITGQVHYDHIMEQFGTDRLCGGMVKVVSFYHAMPALLSITSVLVSRAGATTLAEVTALGVPAILIPSPYVTHHHQDSNASVLVEKEAAVILAEQDLTPKSLEKQIDGLIKNPFRLEAMAKASRSLGKTDALQRIDREISRLAVMA